MEENMQETANHDLILSDHAINFCSYMDVTKVKATAKRSASSSFVSQKLQKSDLSLEAYAHVFLSIQKRMQLNLEFCSMGNLRKVLLANNLSAKKATKEFIIAHLHELPLFKPFFSSVGVLNDKNLLVDPIGIKLSDLGQDLKSLQWLEYGRVLVEADAHSLVGILAEDISTSSPGCQLPKPPAPNYRYESYAANLYPASLNNGCNIAEKCCESHVSSLGSRPVPCARNNLHENAPNSGNVAGQYVVHLDQGQLSTPEGSNNPVVVGPHAPCEARWFGYTEKLPSCFTSDVTNPCRPICRSQQKNMEKEGQELVSVIDLDLPQCTTLARNIEAEADKSPWQSPAFMHVASSKTNHQQLDVMNNSCSVIGDENLCPAGELNLFQLCKNEACNSSSGTLQLQSQDMAPKQLVCPENFNRKKIGNASIDSSSQDPQAQLTYRTEEACTLNCNTSTLDMATQALAPNVLLQNHKRGGEFCTGSSLSQPPSQSKTAVQELVQLASPQLITILDRVNPPVSPSHSTMAASMSKVFVKCPSNQPTNAAYDPVQLVSPKTAGSAAPGQEKKFVCSRAQDGSSAPPSQTEPYCNDAASAGFFEVLRDSSSRGAFSACNENSFNLLEQWEKRRQQSSDLRGRAKTKIQGVEARSTKRVYLQQGRGEVWQDNDGGGDCSSLYSRASMAKNCSSLSEETCKLPSA